MDYKRHLQTTERVDEGTQPKVAKINKDVAVVYGGGEDGIVLKVFNSKAVLGKKEVDALIKILKNT